MISENLIRIRKLDKDLIPEAIEDMERYLSIATAWPPIVTGKQIGRAHV